MSTSHQNNESKRNGLITTILVHALLLLLCLFLGFTYYTPPAGDVAIGFEALGVENGGVSDDLASSEKIAEEPQEVSESQQQAINPVENSYATQDNSPVNVKSSPKVTPQKTAEEIQKEKEEKEKRDKQAKLDQQLSALKGPNNKGGKGEGGKSGLNEGSENGIPNGEGGKGGLNEGDDGRGGNGMFDFGGRKATAPGKLKHDCGVQGSVKIKVKVNKQGNVVDAYVVPGGTSFSNCLINKAVAAAKATQYNANSSGPEFQEGTITLNFSLN